MLTLLDCANVLLMISVSNQITTNEIADAISTHLSKQGTQRAIQLRSSNWIEITPPPSPVRNRGGNRSSSIDEE